MKKVIKLLGKFCINLAMFNIRGGAGAAPYYSSDSNKMAWLLPSFAASAPKVFLVLNFAITKTLEETFPL
jgi:hypothetical protein